jgi:hypothetical protein
MPGSKPSAAQNDGATIGTGVIAGITSGCVLLVLLIVFVICLLAKKRSQDCANDPDWWSDGVPISREGPTDSQESGWERQMFSAENDGMMTHKRGHFARYE